MELSIEFKEAMKLIDNELNKEKFIQKRCDDIDDEYVLSLKREIDLLDKKKELLSSDI